MLWKPTKAERDLIKMAAASESMPKVRFNNLDLQPGERFCTDVADGVTHINIAKVSKCDNWDDTDLFDFSDWATFCKGVELTEDGRAIVDFYIYPKRPNQHNDGLCGNATVYYSGNQIASIKGGGGNVLYTAPSAV